MKKLLLVLATVLLAIPAFAQTWHTADSKTFAWNAVPPVQPTDVIKYQAYTKFRTTDAIPVKIGGEVIETQLMVTFSAEGRYYLCAQTVRYPEGETQPLTSDIVCSDQAQYCQGGNTFGVKYFIKPDGPGGLR